MDLDRLRHFFRLSPFMVDLGVEPIAFSPATASEPARLTTRLLIAPRHMQHTGQVHAGVMASLADHSMGAVAQTQAPDDHWIVTAELKTSLLRAAKGTELVCVAQVLKPGRMLSFTEAEVFAQAPGQPPVLVMKASATMAVTAASRYSGP